MIIDALRPILPLAGWPESRVRDVEIIGIVVNEKGAERAIATKGVATLGYPCSVSETFLRKNQNQTLAESHKALESIKEKAGEANKNELWCYTASPDGR